MHTENGRVIVIIKILIATFGEQDMVVFDEIITVLSKYSDVEISSFITNEPMFSLHDWDVYPSRRKIYFNKSEVHLTGKEFDIFYYLASNRGQVLTYEQIYHKVWKNNAIGVENNAIGCHVRNLKKKLQNASPSIKIPFSIDCVRNVGYRFTLNVE